jgi:hypothetical protein
MLTDVRRPWEKPAATGTADSAAVAGFAPPESTALPGSAPEPTRPSPSRPPGSRSHQPRPTTTRGQIRQEHPCNRRLWPVRGSAVRALPRTEPGTVVGSERLQQLLHALDLLGL